jgi:uncharacterized protein YndB with AHSA1/START domain
MTTIEYDIIAQATIMIHASVEDVWRALTDPAAIREYMFGATVKSNWQPGDSITWKGEWEGKSYQDKGTVLQVIPNQLIQYTHYSPLSGKEDTAENYHIVTITLAEEDPGVWVALTQDKNFSDKERDHSEKNWKTMLEGLKKYVESR